MGKKLSKKVSKKENDCGEVVAKSNHIVIRKNVLDTVSYYCIANGVIDNLWCHRKYLLPILRIFYDENVNDAFLKRYLTEYINFLREKGELKPIICIDRWLPKNF